MPSRISCFSGALDNAKSIIGTQYICLCHCVVVPVSIIGACSHLRYLKEIQHVHEQLIYCSMKEIRKHATLFLKYDFFKKDPLKNIDYTH